MHSVVALDLLFQFFPDSKEFRAMWTISLWAKALWVVISLLGTAAVILLYRRATLGFLLSLAFCVGLYFASIELWHEVKGGFWLAAGASALAAIGAVRSNSSASKPKPLRGSA